MASPLIGFTLTELVISLGLCALLLSSVLALWVSLSKSQFTQQQQLDMSIKRQLLQHYFSESFKAANGSIPRCVQAVSHIRAKAQSDVLVIKQQAGLQYLYIHAKKPSLYTKCNTQRSEEILNGVSDLKVSCQGGFCRIQVDFVKPKKTLTMSVSYD